jgi:thymidylate synthase ThyX
MFFYDMAYEAKILADSISEQGDRLTTFLIKYPRFVHAELMTHRVFSRNSASSRAIPVGKMLASINEDPVLPVWWGKNQSGMQAKEELPSDTDSKRNTVLPALTKEWAEYEWLYARDEAVKSTKTLYQGGKGLHKQIANRIVEPWMWITVIVTATEWENFFKLRQHEDAQPEIKRIADMMAALYYDRDPSGFAHLAEGEWHTPLWGFDEDLEDEHNVEICLGRHREYNVSREIWVPKKVAVSIGRCARVSYLTHEGKRDLEADIKLCIHLAESGHWSPFEHVATPFTKNRWAAYAPLCAKANNLGLSGREYQEIQQLLQFSGNFRGWTQARKLFPQESGSRPIPYPY